MLVPPMSPDELREAIIKPAAHAGLVVERALTARLLSESADEDGSLPLVSHALLEIWRRRRGRVLTEAAYDETGGIQGAIARTADDLYARLSPAQAEAARRLLLRLITPGQGTPDTRRSAPRAEIAALGNGSTEDTEIVLERLARARLVTLDEDCVDLAHEAVLAGWPLLRSWLDADRDRLRAQRRLTEAAANWQSLERDTGALCRGLRLDEATGYFADPEQGGELTELEAEFLEASRSARKRERHRRRAGITALSTLLVLSLLAGLAAWQQNRSSEQRSREVEARRIVLAEAFGSRWDRAPALTRFSRAGDRLAVARADPDGRRLRVSVLDARTGALLASPPRVSCPPDGAVGRYSCGSVSLAFNSTGRTLAYGVTGFDASAPGRIALYDTARRRITTALSGADLGRGDWQDTAFTPDDGKLIVAGASGPSPTTRIWDLGQKAIAVSIPEASGSPVLSPDGTLLTTLSGSAFRMPSGTPLSSARTPGQATAMAFSPDGKYLAVGEGSGRIVLWDGRITRRLGELVDPDTPTRQYVSALAFTPDSRTLAVAGDEGALQLWDTNTRQRIGSPLPTAGDTIGSLAFDGNHTLRAAGDHAPPRTYDLSVTAVVRAVCRRTGRQFTPDQWSAHLPGVPYRQTCP